MPGDTQGKGNGGRQANGGNGHRRQQQQDAATAHSEEAALDVSGDWTQGQSRGLDSGLAKAAPKGENLTQKSYRSYRRRLELFSLQCRRRGRDAEIEGAFLVVSLWRDVVWEAAEQLDLDTIELEENPFKPLFTLLDQIFQREDLIEVPNRCEEFFAEFNREKGEEMQAYLMRHRTLMKKMKEVGVEIPKLLGGWHLLSRSGIPRWMFVQIKTMCNGELEYERVAKALLRVFGGDHKPNAKDLARHGKDDAFFEDEIEEDEEVWYEEECQDDWAEEQYVDEGDEAYYEEEIPEDVEEALDETEDAFVNYMESRRRMRELALSRGFYPVVAIGPEAGGKSYGKGKGGSKGKGKGKSKGGSKGKGKGKGFQVRRSFGNRRPMSGLRRDNGSTTTPSSNTSDFKSTLGGSTASHGPRFKRYRVQSNGVKEVPDEQISMVEEIVEIPQHDCFFNTAEPGEAIVDSGATRTIVGEQIWNKWVNEFPEQLGDVQTHKVVRDFRFGGGEVLRSSYDVTFRVKFMDQNLQLQASVVPGNTPFLIARPTLELWKAKHDYATGKMKLAEGEWFSPKRGEKGHYMLRLLRGKEQVFEVQEEGICSDEDRDAWMIESTLEKEAGMKKREDNYIEIETEAEDVLKVVDNALDRKLKFFEIYVDRGNLSSHLAANYPDVEVSTFSLPDWDFTKQEHRHALIELIKEVRPHFVFIAPPCTKWSSIQGLNAKTPAQRAKLVQARNEEEKSHLQLAKDVFQTGNEMDSPAGMEHPDRARSWETDTMKKMKGYYEAVCDRCRTGLKIVDEDGITKKVRKPTRIRTQSRIVADAMNLPCKCQEGHLNMIGRSKELKEMQNYEPGFVRVLGKAIYREMERQWMRREMSQIMVAEEMSQEEMQQEEERSKRPGVTEQEKQQAKEHGAEALKVVQKLHKQLGHPSNDRLILALRDAKMDEKILKCAATYECAACKTQMNKQLSKPTSLPLPQAHHFNELLEMDVYHIKWRGERKKILAVIDIFSRFEMNAVIKGESEKEETKALEEKWIAWAGYPQKIRTDSSGAHMSEEFQTWCDDRGIRLILVPKEAHHRMGTVERLHAVRRQQLHKMMLEDESITLLEAVNYSTMQRNRLRNIHGTSPSNLVFGSTPSLPGLSDEPHGIQPDGTPAAQRQQHLRHVVAKAFYEANHDSTIRRALLAKSRAEHVPLSVGSYAYYWRTANDKLETSRWRGPALICAIEPRTDDKPGGINAYWLVHGCSLVRTTPEHVRPEVSSERLHRLDNMPDTALREPWHQQLTRALKPTRGPIRFLDFGPHPAVSDATSFNQASPMDSEEQQPDKMQRTSYTQQAQQQEPKQESEEQAGEQAEQAQDTGMASSDANQDKQTVEQEVEQLFEQLDEWPQIQHDEGKQEEKKENDDKMEQAEQENKKECTRERSRSPVARDETYQKMLRQSVAHARKLDGLPTVKVDEDMDEELLAEEFSERNLTPEQKKEFDKAKDEALQVWITNKAWKAVPAEDAREGEVVPARFIQRWKPKPEHPNGRVANARVILQGFRHNDVLTKELEKESPTLSRVGRMSILNMLTHKQWKLFSADVKSAFMQADSIDADTRIYIQPTADMRRRLERMMGLKEYEILKATKPPFGDVRAPRQWYSSADRTMTEELQFLRHPLDRCVYLSIRDAQRSDEPERCFEVRKRKVTVDGVLGLHVDDYIGGGENVHGEQDMEGEYDGQFLCFRDRLCGLARRFRFGSWSFGPTVHFCGMEIVQSMDYTMITLSLQKYVSKVKPITIDKARKAMSQDLCDERECRQLRALVGALAWPANQCLPQLGASVSMLQGALSGAKVQDIVEANKILRFAKEVVQKYEMRMSKHGAFEKIRYSAYCDAAWATRQDNSSQGGYLIFVANETELTQGKPMPLTIVDWASRKLQRMCRSSLAAEAQSAAIAVDELEWMKVFNAAMINPLVEIESEEVLLMTGQSFLVTDAKSLYDASRSMSSGLKLSEKRTAIEVSIVNQRLAAMSGTWRWVNSHQQMADGLTKTAAKDKFHEVLQRGVHQLKYDEKFTASKKVTKEEKKQEEDELRKASKYLREEVYVMTEEEKEKNGICLVEGCEKKADKSSNTRNKFCSRRHFYKHLNGVRGEEDVWKNVALRSAAIVAASEFAVAEGKKEEDKVEGEGILKYVITFALIAATVVFFVVKWWKKQQQQTQNTEQHNTHTQQHDISNAIASHVEQSREPMAEPAPHDATPESSDAGSSSSGLESEALENDPNDPPRPRGKFILSDFKRWKRIRDLVMREERFEGWKQKMEQILRGHTGAPLVDPKRIALVESHTTYERMMRFEFLYDKSIARASDEEIWAFHRFCTMNNVEMYAAMESIEQEHRKARQLRLENLRLESDLADLNQTDVMCQRVKEDLVRDMQIQTALTFAWPDQQSYGSEQTLQSRNVRQLPARNHGAWNSRSSYDTHG